MNDFVVVVGSGPCTHIYIQLALISKKTSEIRVSFLRVKLSILSLSSKVYMVQKKMACLTGGKNLVGTGHSHDDDEVKSQIFRKKVVYSFLMYERICIINVYSILSVFLRFSMVL